MGNNYEKYVKERKNNLERYEVILTYFSENSDRANDEVNHNVYLNKIFSKINNYAERKC